MKFSVSQHHNTVKYISRCDKSLKYVRYYLMNVNYFCQNIMYVFIMLPIFLIQAHDAIKYVINYVEKCLLLQYLFIT